MRSKPSARWGQRDENEVRKPLTPSEAVALAKALEPQEQEDAKERMVEAHASPSKLDELSIGRTDERVEPSANFAGGCRSARGWECRSNQ